MPRILLITIFVGISIIVGILFLWPKYQNFQITQRQLENKEIELLFRKEYYQQLDSLSEKLKEFSTEVSKIDSALPLDSSSAALSFYNFLQKVSLENGLIMNSIGSFSLSPLSARPDVQIISIPIGATGSYAALKNFLKALEKSSRIIEVNSIFFSSPGEEGLFAFQLEIQTYSY